MCLYCAFYTYSVFQLWNCANKKNVNNKHVITVQTPQDYFRRNKLCERENTFKLELSEAIY